MMLCTMAFAVPYDADFGEEELFYSEVEINPYVDYVFDTENDAQLLSSSFDDYIYAALYEMQEIIDVRGLNFRLNDAEELENLYYTALRTNPELFYVAHSYTYRYNSYGKIIEIRPDYIITDKDAIRSAQEEMFEKIDKIVSYTDETMTDFEKLLTVYDNMAMIVSYDDTLQNRTAKTFFVDGKTVCEGYTLALYAVLTELEIPCGFVTSEEMKHIWNCIKIDGEWYHADLTWDDPFKEDSLSVTHTYFLKSDDWMETDRKGNKHYGFTRLENDTKFDDCFLNDVVSVTTVYDDKFWYIDNNGFVTVFDADTDTKRKLYTLNKTWPAGEGTCWNAVFSGVAVYNNRLYFNTYNKILSCTLDGNDVKTEFTLDDYSDTSIYGCYREGSSLCYAMGNRSEYRVINELGYFNLPVVSTTYSGYFENEDFPSVKIFPYSTVVRMYADDEWIDFGDYDSNPLYILSEILVPVRFLYDIVGADVEYDSNTKTVTITKNDIEINAVLEENYITVNGVRKDVPVPAQIINLRTFVPLAAILEASGYVREDGVNYFLFTNAVNYEINHDGTLKLYGKGNIPDNCDWSFCGDVTVEDVIIEEGITGIGRGAFGFFESIKSITIPMSVMSIDEDVFYDSENVTIYGYYNSYAHKYAEQNNISFEAVDYVAVENITLSESQLVLKQGKTHTFFAFVYPEIATEKQIIWSSSDENVVTVENGVVTAHSIGTAQITAKSQDESKSAYCDVIVEPADNTLYIFADNITGRTQEEVTFNITLEHNPGFSGMIFWVTYDQEVLELTDVKMGIGESAWVNGFENNPLQNPLMFAAATTENITGDGVLSTLKFRVKDDACEGAYPIMITVDGDSVFGYDGFTETDLFVVVENGEITVVEFLAGDANGDNIVNNRDAARILQHVAGWDVEINESAADVNGDNTVNNRDAARILQYIAGWDVVFS